MKVKELIQILEKLDPEICVFVEGYEGGYNFASFDGNVEDFALKVHEEWYYGAHDKVSYMTEEFDNEIVKGIIL
jgi:hypothetical protein